MGILGALPLPRKAVRLAVQTAVAALAAYAIVESTDLPEGSWAVISALFTVDSSVGATLGGAVGRIVGTALGTLLGVGCILLIGEGDWRTAAGLLIIAATVHAVAALRPSTRFGVVAGSILLLTPAGDPVSRAMSQALAIGLGTIIGSLTAMFVLPEPAHRNARQHLGTAIRRCGDLLATGLALLTGKDRDGDLQPIHDDIRHEIEAASAMAEQSIYPTLRVTAGGPAPGALLRRVQRLWHTLILIDRAEDGPLPDRPRHQLAPALDDLSTAACAYLTALAATVTEGEPAPSQRAFQDRLRALDQAMAAMRDDGATRALPSEEAERVFALSFALRELARDIDGIARLCDPNEPTG